MTKFILALNELKFSLGEVVATANALTTLDPADIQQGLSRHSRGDWGDICDDDRKANELSLKQGCRLMSVYGSGDKRFWIITEADRSVTTVLLPLDY
jgi:hypothetical protein